MNIQQEIQKALEYYQSGDLPQAKQICKRILKKQPQNAEVLYFLGVIYSHSENHELAIQYIKKSLEFSPHNSDAYHLVGMSYQAQGKLDEAIEYYRKTIQHNPSYAEAYNNLGNVLKERRQFEEAIGYYQKAVELKPDLATTYYNLGVIYQEKKDYDEAINYYRKALRYDPSNHTIQSMLGFVLYTKWQFEGSVESLQESERILRKIVLLHTNDYVSYGNLGNVLKDQGQIDEATVCYRKAIELNPDFIDAYFNLAVTLQETGLIDEAVSFYQKAIEINPTSTDIQNNMGILWNQKNSTDNVLPCFQKPAEVDNTSSIVLTRSCNNLGNIYSEMGQIDKAEGYYRRALAINPHLSFIHSNLLLSMNYDPRHGMDALFSEHMQFAKQHADALSPNGFYANERQIHRRLRIGYVSPDFRKHSVAYFIEPVLDSHDRTKFEVFCYSDVAGKDEVTERIQKLSDQWRDISALDHEKVSKVICEDKIDILVDLAGHTGKNRLMVFARKPAPVQVTWIGYPSTTGLSRIDYKIVDQYTDPTGITEKYYTENLVRMPQCFLCYLPDRDAPGMNDLPAQDNGYITFGSFNNFAKVSNKILLLWVQILRALPGARLVMKAKWLSSTSVRKTISDFFQQQGIDPVRIELCSVFPSVSEHLALYNRIDIALDTFPYNGTTTTCEALYMGVPVVTLGGDTCASRVGVSLLSNTGLKELIAGSPEEYVEIAVQLATDMERLATLRASLRDRVSQSPLTNAKVFTAHLENAYREMWTEWCGKK